jgi:hypothetical protein
LTLIGFMPIATHQHINGGCSLSEFSPLLHTTCGPSTVQPLETLLFRLTAQLTLSVMDPFGGHPGAITNRVEGKILTNVV